MWCRLWGCKGSCNLVDALKRDDIPYHLVPLWVQDKSVSDQKLAIADDAAQKIKIEADKKRELDDEQRSPRSALRTWQRNACSLNRSCEINLVLWREQEPKEFCPTSKLSGKINKTGRRRIILVSTIGTPSV